MNNATVKFVRAYLKEQGIDLKSPLGKRIYRNVKRDLHNKDKIKLAIEEKSQVSS